MEIGLVPNGGKREPGALAYWTESDIAASVKRSWRRAARSCKRSRTSGYGMLVASVKDPNGAIVGLRQPPIKMVRNEESQRLGKP